MSSKQGKLIVFEGIDGCGKDTQIKLLKNNLKKYTLEPVVTISNISQGQLGKLIRRMLGPDRDELFITDRQVACIFLAELFIVVDNIKKLLAQGYNVICSRYYYSTIAYAGVTPELYQDIITMAKFDIEPDILIYLDLDVDQAMTRLNSNRETLEIFEKKELLESIRMRYRNILINDSIIKPSTTLLEIDATLPIQEISDIIFTEVEKQI